MESLARGGPWLLGSTRRGKSTWRELGEAETEKFGGSSRRRLYGCVLTMFSSRTRKTAFGGGTGMIRPEAFEQQLLTWSQVYFLSYSLSPTFCTCIDSVMVYPHMYCEMSLQYDR